MTLTSNAKNIATEFVEAFMIDCRWIKKATMIAELTQVLLHARKTILKAHGLVPKELHHHTINATGYLKEHVCGLFITPGSNLSKLCGEDAEYFYIKTFEPVEDEDEDEDIQVAGTSGTKEDETEATEDSDSETGSDDDACSEDESEECDVCGSHVDVSGGICEECAEAMEEAMEDDDKE